MTVLPVRRARADVRRDLAVLAAGQPPFVSVYLDLSPGDARATAPARLRSGLDRALDAAGAAEGVLAFDRSRVESAVVDAPDDDALFVAVANADGGLVTATYPDPPRRDVVSTTDVPRLGPLLAADQSLTHHVVAVVRGGELTLMTVPRHGEATHITYEGSDPLAVAPIVQQACRKSDTTLLIVCAPSGELKAAAEQIRGGLPVNVNLATVPLDGHDVSSLATEIVVRAADHAATKTVELLHLYRFHQSHGETVEGADATCAALADGRAGLVLVNDDEDDDRRGWLAPAAGGLAPMATPKDQDVGNWRAGRLADVVISAAVIAGCGVHLVPNVDQTLADGFGSILTDRADPAGLAELLER